MRASLVRETCDVLSLNKRTQGCALGFRITALQALRQTAKLSRLTAGAAAVRTVGFAIAAKG
jgi:hypothetical protein